MFITLKKVVLSFEPVDKLLMSVHSNESYLRAFYSILWTVVMLYKVVLTFASVNNNHTRTSSLEKS